MKVKQLLEEYNLDIDDLRWHLCTELSQRLLSHGKKPDELTRLIWAGTLEEELYDMEERWLRQTQAQLDEKTLDEAHLRDRLAEMEISRRRRKGY